MDYLWTPWRFQYVAGLGNRSACVFCAAAAAGNDREWLVVHRATHHFVILNRFPYTSGHLMVVPYAHLADLEELPPDALPEMMRLGRRAVRHLKKLYRPNGLNLGMNLGEAAGAGIASHLHLHVLPRWIGDTSFMTVTGETRVLPEALETTWEKLRGAFETEAGGEPA
ncbi:MAG: HIT family protein [Bryobacteraceae bacterium]